MKQQSLTWFSWKRLFITIIIVGFLLLIVYIFTTNNYIKASKTKGFDHTESIILQETNMASVHDMYAFQDEILYHIAYALDEQDKEWIIFVPKTEKTKANDDKADKKKKENAEEKVVEKQEFKEDDIFKLETNDLVTEGEIESTWAEECNQCLLKSSSPAIIDDTPAWELTYIDDNNRFVMEYRNLKDAKIVEQLKLRRKYNVKG